MNAPLINRNTPLDLGWVPRSTLVVLVAAAHAALGWVVLNLSQTPAAKAPLPRAIEVTLIASPAADNPQHEPTPGRPMLPQPLQRALRPKVDVAAAAAIATSTVTASPSEVTLQSVATPSPGSIAAADPSAVPSTQPAVPAPAPLAWPKGGMSSAVSYIDPPKRIYPRISAELCETGTVMLDVLVNESGVPVEVSVEKSSGFERLDQAAVAAMRAARFKPHVESGQARPSRAHAPINYKMDC